MSKRILSVLCCLLCCVATFANAEQAQKGAGENTKAEYPKVLLDNDLIKVSVFLPDAEKGYYRGTRFDWSGIIETVTYNGHTFYAPLHETHDPTAHDSVSGPAEEFGMYHPMGFDEAKPGETFVKIGVGLLEKNQDKEYQFYGDYKLIKTGNWQINTSDTAIEFSQQLATQNGWGYHYTKRIELLENQAKLRISHQLKNTGSKRIELDNYSHNFTLIDDTPYGPNYSVTFPFKTEKPSLINQLAWFKGHNMTVNKPLNDRALWHIVKADPGDASNNSATVTNKVTGAQVSFKGDAPITHFIFWAVERAACPEPFINIDIAPSEQKTWQTTYTYSVKDAH